MTDIDKEKLRDFLNEQAELLKQGIQERTAEDPDDDLAKRMDGGTAAIHILNREIDSGRLDVYAWPPVPDKLPVERMKVPTRNKVRRKDPSTSWAAATSQVPAATQLIYKAIVLILTKKGPQTDEEIERVLTYNKIPHSESGARTRRSELVEAGWVRDSGQKRPGKNGNPMIVWEAV